MLAAILLVVAASAATTVVFVRGQFNQLAHALGSNKSLRVSNGTLAPTGFGQPETLLLIGNDQRAHTTTTPVLPHANEMLLVRIDPGRPWISMMSIPRELQVPIHTPANGIVTTRLNAALFYGGINLVVSTIKQVTGLSVNHVVVIDFNNFKRAVNEMGCVYGTIDRRYFHVNVPGGPQYFQVNLQPGYQKLCGEQALQFVTYRHGDTSLERDARDQDFLLEVKQQYGPTLIDHIKKFEDIFGQTVQTDPGLHTTNGVENLVGTLISVASRPVRQVKFKADIGAQTNCACVTATPQEIHQSVDEFLNGRGLPPAKKSTAALARHVHGGRKAPAGIVPVPAATAAQATSVAHHLPFPLEFPNIEVNNGYGLPTAFRSYSIAAPGGHRYPIYVAVFSTGLLGQYYDVQGTTWLTAPVFDSPGQTIKVAGRTYYLYYSGQHIKAAAWFAHGAGYWVQNTLTLGLTNTQMLAISEHTAPLIGAGAGSVRSDARQQTAAPSSVAVVSTATSPLQTVGKIGGLLAVLAAFVGCALLWRRHAQLRDLAFAAGSANERLATLERQLARVAGATPLSGSRSAITAGARARTRPRPARGAAQLPVAAVAAIAVVGMAIAGVALATSGSGRAAQPRRHHAHPVPAPVEVLNAGTQAGAAGRLARKLRGEHLDVLGAANLNSVAPLGYEVLYTPHARTQAHAVARLLAFQRPIVAPVDPAAQAAAGPRAKVIVVIP